ncbi:MAG TPA: hypothetical protein VKH44_08910 [Pirellulaceae bacterium]|nr:hypothetical protein [Pirellulaceae bacterium]
MPVAFALVNQRLVGQWIFSNVLTATQVAAILLAEIGVFGVLCAKLVQPPQLQWAAYIWMWAMLDLTVIPWAPDGAWWRNPTAFLMPALFSAQLGLVVLWAVFGRAAWTLRWPLAISFFALSIFLPLAADPRGPRYLTFLIAMQTMMLLVTCSCLRWLGYRLIVALPHSPNYHLQKIAQREPGPVQFRVKDVLLWTTLTAMLLALARALDIVASLSSTLLGRSAGITSLAGGLTALVLTTALGAVLGDGKAWTRWIVLAATMLLGIGALAVLFAFGISLVLVSGPVVTFWSRQYWDVFVLAQGPLIAWAGFANAMFIAALLFHRTLGYRLCREPKPEN